MDRRNLESRSWLHQDQSRLQPLLCRNFAERFRGVKGHPYEQGFDLRLVPGKLQSRCVGHSKDDLRQFDERFVPQGCGEAYIQAVVKVMEQPTGIPTRCLPRGRTDA